jgi:hypothetical protein
MERRARLLGLHAWVRRDVAPAAESPSSHGTVIILPDDGRDRLEELEPDAEGPDSVPGVARRSLPENGV